MESMEIKNFYKGKKVFITGHTGFKGSWMTVMLKNFGADVIGYSTCSNKDIRLFDLCGVKDEIIHISGDVRDLNHLQEVLTKYRPEIVIHMAAQPIVKISYERPVETYSTNVMGTVNICESIRQTDCVKSFLNVTTDKVYENKELEFVYDENEPLDGYDPYSNSKSCSELVTHSYKKSFFENRSISVSTARSGNVIGGGDFAPNRIIPDCVRAALNNNVINVRNQNSIRPYQHVLDSLFAYLIIVAKQYDNPNYSGWYNVGPDNQDCITTGDLVRLFVKYWGGEIRWKTEIDNGPHESSYLKLDCTKMINTFGWSPKWNIEQAVEKVVEWTKAWESGADVRNVMNKQIDDFLGVCDD